MTLTPLLTTGESILLLTEQFREVMSQPNTDQKLRELDKLLNDIHELLARMEAERGGEPYTYTIACRAVPKNYALGTKGG